jgi:predicted ATP-binding protein involved in virulence
MRVQKIEIDNYRSFSQFTLDLRGESLFFISENGVGKSTLLGAIAKALGRDSSPITKSDFADLLYPIEWA